MNDRVQLFITCLVDSFFPESGMAILKALHLAGCEVEFPPDQTCCGQPAFNAGFRSEARSMAKQTIQVLSQSDSPVIVPSGSCAAMIRHSYPELFSDDPAWHERALQLAQRTYEFSEYLVDHKRMIDFGGEYHGTIAYHPSCHLLRGLGVDRQPLELLEKVRGTTIKRLAPECCGFGGVFSVDQPEISTAMLERKMAAIEELQVDLVVAADVSCLMHIEGGLRRNGSAVRCKHLANLIVGELA
jgi:L-lactate dehydrogenase complex protein LldE